MWSSATHSVFGWFYIQPFTVFSDTGCPDEPVAVCPDTFTTKSSDGYCRSWKRLQDTRADSADYVIIGDIKFYEQSRNVTLKWSTYVNSAVCNLQDVWIMDDMNMILLWPRAHGYQYNLITFQE